MDNPKKDCRLVFTNKKIYDFPSTKLPEALKWAGGRKDIWAIETPFCTLQIVPQDGYEFVRDEMLNSTEVDAEPDDL